MAKWVWIVVGIARSIDAEAKIFDVRRGSQFSDVYMESIVVGSDEEQTSQRQIKQFIC